MVILYEKYDPKYTFTSTHLPGSKFGYKHIARGKRLEASGTWGSSAEIYQQLNKVKNAGPYVVQDGTATFTYKILHSVVQDKTDTSGLPRGGNVMRIVDNTDQEPWDVAYGNRGPVTDPDAAVNRQVAGFNPEEPLSAAPSRNSYTSASITTGFATPESISPSSSSGGASTTSSEAPTRTRDEKGKMRMPTPESSPTESLRIDTSTDMLMRPDETPVSYIERMGFNSIPSPGSSSPEIYNDLLNSLIHVVSSGSSSSEEDDVVEITGTNDNVADRQRLANFKENFKNIARLFEGARDEQSLEYALLRVLDADSTRLMEAHLSDPTAEFDDPVLAPSLEELPPVTQNFLRFIERTPGNSYRLLLTAAQYLTMTLGAVFTDRLFQIMTYNTQAIETILTYPLETFQNVVRFLEQQFVRAKKRGEPGYSPESNFSFISDTIPYVPNPSSLGSVGSGDTLLPTVLRNSPVASSSQQPPRPLQQLQRIQEETEPHRQQIQAAQRKVKEAKAKLKARRAKTAEAAERRQARAQRSQRTVRRPLRLEPQGRGKKAAEKKVGKNPGGRRGS